MDYILSNSRFFENIVESIIRPPRQSHYGSEHIGPEYRFFGSIKVQRVALVIQNSKN